MRMMQNSNPFSFGGSTVMIGESWWPAIQQEMSKQYFIELNTFLTNALLNNVPVLPAPQDIFAWTLACTFDEVKVVIIGQDPYFRAEYGPHGLAFSSLTTITHSLRNIYKKLKSEYPDFEAPNHGYLMGWAEQGVLMLNRWLTVEEGTAGSHRGIGWGSFTNAVISYLNNNKVGLVFILWGAEAKNIATFIDKQKHLVLQGYHPAYYGFFRPIDGRIPQYFSECNNYLVDHGKTPINWGLLPAPAAP